MTANFSESSLFFTKPCDDDPEDVSALVYLYRDSEGARDVVLSVSYADEDDLSMTLRPASARVLAAALLNAADELDGATPLVFMPTCPEHDAKEPQR